MTFEHVRSMDQVLHKSGYLFVIKVVLDDRCAIAHPKYDLRAKEAKRISNPVDPLRSNDTFIDHVLPFGSRDYLIGCEEIERHYPCFEIAPLLETGPDSSAAIRLTARELLAQVGRYIDKKTVGITGSLATGKAIDNYSDIDLVMESSQFEKLRNSDFWQAAGVELRTFAQWKEFYYHYHVLSALTADEFARDALQKRQQFIYRGIPVSIFIVSDGEPFLCLLDSCSNRGAKKRVQLDGTVLAARDDTLPGYAIINAGARAHLAVNFHRSYQGSLRKDHYCVLQGFSDEMQDIVWIDYDDQCAIRVQQERSRHDS